MPSTPIDHGVRGDDGSAPVSYDYDVLVIGSGPAGQKAAIQAAKLRRRVVLVERSRTLGGVCVNTGTIPSKTIREAILYLTGLNQRAIYGQGYRLRDEISVEDIRERTRQVVERERSVIRDQLLRNHVVLLEGAATFVDPRTVAVDDDGGGERRISGETVIIATGSQPARVPVIDVNDETIFDSDSVLRIPRIPDSIVVVGAGVIAIEYASMFAALGSKVTVVDGRHAMLDFCDPEITEALSYHLRDLGVIFRFGEIVTAVEGRPNGTITQLASGKQIAADYAPYPRSPRARGRESTPSLVGMVSA